MQVEHDAGDRADGQRSEHPGVRLPEPFPQHGQHSAARQQHGQPWPAHGCRRWRLDRRQAPGEQRGHDQHHQQQTSTVRRGDLGRVCGMAARQVDHLAGTARQAGEERRGAVGAAAQQDEDADQAQQQGAEGAGQYHPQVLQYLLHHLVGEMQADGAGDQPLPGGPAVWHFLEHAAAATYRDHRQQRTDDPGQRPADQARQVATDSAEQGRQPPVRQLADGSSQCIARFKHSPVEHSAGRVCARCARSAERSSAPPDSKRPR